MELQNCILSLSRKINLIKEKLTAINWILEHLAHVDDKKMPQQNSTMGHFWQGPTTLQS